MNMSNTGSNNNSFLAIGKELLDESLVIPIDGYSAQDEEEGGKKRFYGFRVGELQLLINPEVRSEVFNELVVTTVPLMPKCVSGLCSVRGSLVPVYDMHEKLELKQDATLRKDKKILVLDEGENMVGIEVDDMVVSLQFDEQDKQENAKSNVSKMNEFVTYGYKHKKEHWFGFDHNKFFMSN